MQKVEFKVQNPHSGWEATPISLVIEGGVERSLIDRFASLLAQIRSREVRWNYAGSPQGHYRQPTDSTKRVVIEIYGGSPIQMEIPAGIEVEIVDHDLPEGPIPHTRIHTSDSVLCRVAGWSEEETSE